LALVLSMSTWFSATAVIPQLRDEWGLTTGQASWLTIAVQVGFVVGAFVSAVGTIADIVSSRWVIVAGASGASLANLALLTADRPAIAIPLRAATGFFLAGVYPPALKLIATWFRQRRGRALGVLVGALTVGSALPHLVNAGGGLEWRVVVVVTSLLTIAGAVVVAVAIREGPFPFPKAPFDPRQAAGVFRDRQVRLATLGYFGHMWELYAMWAWFLVFFSARTDVGPEGAALVTFAVIAVGALGCWMGGVLGDRWSRSKTTTVMMIVSGASALVAAALHDAPWPLLAAVGIVWGITVIGDSAQFSALVTEFADQTYVGTALTLQLSLGFALTVATIWLVPFVERNSSWSWAIAMLAVGPALGIAAMARLAPTERTMRSRSASS